MATFKPITNVEKASFEPRACVQNSIKEFFFPKHETLFSFVRQGNDVVLTDAADFDVEQIVVGARPCDAAALPILDPLFAWDYQDRFYQERRAKTTVVTFACTKSDAHCFCSAVGLGVAAAAASFAALRRRCRPKMITPMIAASTARIAIRYARSFFVFSISKPPVSLSGFSDAIIP